MLRPTHHHVAPSPRVAPSHAGSSSSSSITSSPIQSPQTNPYNADYSPEKGAFDLPPLAYPKESTMPAAFAFPGSMPVKIPHFVSRTPQSHTPGTHTPASNGTVYPIGASIDTLRFGRKPGLTNSVTSPNALLPRCACGKPANHRNRAMSKDRGVESGLSNLVLGPSVTYEPPQRTARIVSDPAASPGKPQLINNFIHAATGPNTPSIDARGASYLSRSRSDPIPSSPETQRNVIAPSPNRVSASRRASNTAYAQKSTFSPVMRPVVDLSNNVAPASLSASPRRGRSRERANHPLEREISATGFNHPPDREHPPSRSRHRREERRRSDESRERQRVPATALSPVVEPPQIMPSWNRRSPDDGIGEGVAPTRRNGTGSPRSPVVDSDPRQAALRRASNQLGAVFGVAAG